jgi:NAD(P)-dependent dehydrogenase (short-subunit alcohol dehydrogenase family)
MAPLQVAVITGTAKAGGIGRAIAMAFLRSRYSVLGIDILPLEAPVALGERYHHLEMDVRLTHKYTASVPNLVAEQFGQEAEITCLVNNAAVVDPVLPEDETERVERWQHVLETNLTGETEEKSVFFFFLSFFSSL